MSTNTQVRTEDFFRQHPVFTLDEAAQVLRPRGGRAAITERLKYHISQGRLKRLARELYASVPSGQSPFTFQPDVYLAALALRPDGIFCYHSALDLLGASHSAWHQHILFTDQRRPPLVLPNGNRILFLESPVSLRRKKMKAIGTQQAERSGRLFRLTGPERTLVEGFRRLDLVGGLEELVNSAAGFPYLDLDLLARILNAYNLSGVWAAVGWFLEKHQQVFQVPEVVLQLLESHRPKGPQYLGQRRPGGTLISRWNLILPQGTGEPDEH